MEAWRWASNSLAVNERTVATIRTWSAESSLVDAPGRGRCRKDHRALGRQNSHASLRERPAWGHDRQNLQKVKYLWEEDTRSNLSLNQRRTVLGKVGGPGKTEVRVDLIGGALKNVFNLKRLSDSI